MIVACPKCPCFSSALDSVGQDGWEWGIQHLSSSLFSFLPSYPPFLPSSLSLNWGMPRSPSSLPSLALVSDSLGSVPTNGLHERVTPRTRSFSLGRSLAWGKGGRLVGPVVFLPRAPYWSSLEFASSATPSWADVWSPVLCAGEARNNLLARFPLWSWWTRSCEACEGWNCAKPLLLYHQERQGEEPLRGRHGGPVRSWPQQLRETRKKFPCILLQKGEGTEEIELSVKSDNECRSTDRVAEHNR